MSLRRFGRGLLVLWAAVTLAVLPRVSLSPRVGAMSIARISVVQTVHGYDGAVAGSAPQAWSMLVKAYAQAGVNTRDWMTPEGLISDTTTIANITAPEPSGPAPGDIAVFQATLPGGEQSLAVFVTGGDVVVWNRADGKFHDIPRAALDGASTEANGDFLYAKKGSVSARRINAQFWPLRTDDTSIPPGKVELLDPAEAAKQIQWTESHPRDPDQSFWHQLWRTGMNGASWLSERIGGLISKGLAGGDWLLHNSGALGIGALMFIGFLTTKFDGTGINHVLTDVISRPLVVPLTLMAAGLKAAGLDWAANKLTSVRNGVWNIGSFVVAVFTGCEGEGESTVGGVALAVVSDAVVVAKPLALGTRATEFLGRLTPVGRLLGRGGLTASSVAKAGASGLNRAADLVELRPSTWFEQGAGLLKRIPVLSAGTARTTAALGKFEEPLSRLGNLFSLIWRQHSALTESAQTLEVVASRVGALEKALPLLAGANRALDTWSAGQHLTYISTHGALPTVAPPRRLRPHEFLQSR